MFTISNLITTKDYKWKQFVNFIGGHYHRNKENVFLPRIENVNPYFTNHTHPSFITFYYEKILLENVEKKSMIPSKKIISTMLHILNILSHSIQLEWEKDFHQKIRQKLMD